ncbi:hypothetical protein H1P_950021 [Hyella patelloides LEGE 07179]|uniref:Uncharacterized protein n=1 Tax=Hyella patelloides LEGE 07179 TaxID=945734 RepID=A0A563W5H4_9CYAN|nr:hypothetical protein H1P_950021 [Hyella patelloides LEGE 07179]
MRISRSNYTLRNHRRRPQEQTLQFILDLIYHLGLKSLFNEAFSHCIKHFN